MAVRIAAIIILVGFEVLMFILGIPIAVALTILGVGVALAQLVPLPAMFTKSRPNHVKPPERN